MFIEVLVYLIKGVSILVAVFSIYVTVRKIRNKGFLNAIFGERETAIFLPNAQSTKFFFNVRDQLQELTDDLNKIKEECVFCEKLSQESLLYLKKICSDSLRLIEVMLENKNIYRESELYLNLVGLKKTLTSSMKTQQEEPILTITLEYKLHFPIMLEPVKMKWNNNTVLEKQWRKSVETKWFFPFDEGVYKFLGIEFTYFRSQLESPITSKTFIDFFYCKIIAIDNNISKSLNKFYFDKQRKPLLDPEDSIPITIILVLAANPNGTDSLRLGEEVSSIQKGLERSKHRDLFRIEPRWAITTTDVRRALLDCQPQIVHFCGHGKGTESPKDSSIARDVGVDFDTQDQPEGLVFEDITGQPHLVSTEAIATLFSLFSRDIECVVLNACYSATQADAIAEHIPYVVGMKRAIGDRAAIEFAIGFYDALLAGRDVDFAFQLGRSSIQMEGIPEHLTPTLKHKSI